MWQSIFDWFTKYTEVIAAIGDDIGTLFYWIEDEMEFMESLRGSAFSKKLRKGAIAKIMLGQ